MFTTGHRLWNFTDKKRLFWLLQSVGWCAMMLVALGILRSPGGDLAQFILFRSVFGFLVTAFLLRPILRHLWKRYVATPSWLIPSLIGSVVLFGSADAYGSLWIFNIISRLQVNDETSRIFVNSSLTLRCGIYALWVSLYISINHFIDTAREQLRLAQLETETRESELQLLRAQVNPHFLFNALNTILAVAEEPQRVSETTHALADYLRFSLAQNSELHPLGKELDALENYLRVEKIRFEERLEYTLEADEAVRCQLVPGALVQPLLENAIKYGQCTSPPPLRVTICAQMRADGGLLLVVENSGHWVEPGRSGSTGIGLANLRRRLELLYGDRAMLSIETTAHRVCVRVELPLEPIEFVIS
jgi:sensor histidine kinase YesM